MEQLTNFIIWMFVVMGVTIITTQSNLLAVPRQKLAKLNKYLGMLTSCGLCFSFWAALGVSYLMESMTGNLFLDGCLGSGIFWYVTYGDMMAQNPHPMHQQMPPQMPPGPPISENIQKDTKD